MPPNHNLPGIVLQIEAVIIIVLSLLGEEYCFYFGQHSCQHVDVSASLLSRGILSNCVVSWQLWWPISQYNLPHQWCNSPVWGLPLCDKKYRGPGWRGLAGYEVFWAKSNEICRHSSNSALSSEKSKGGIVNSRFTHSFDFLQASL